MNFTEDIPREGWERRRSDVNYEASSSIQERAANVFEEERKDGFATVVAELLCCWMLLFGASGMCAIYQMW